MDTGLSWALPSVFLAALRFLLFRPGLAEMCCHPTVISLHVICIFPGILEHFVFITRGNSSPEQCDDSIPICSFLCISNLCVLLTFLAL